MTQTSFKNIWFAIEQNNLIEAKEMLDQLQYQTADEKRNKHVLQAMIEAKLGNYDLAIEIMNNVLSENAIANDHNLLANIYSKKNDIEQAENHYLKAIALDSNYYVALQNLANLYYKHDQLDKALKIYTKLYESTKDDNILYHICSILIKQDHLETAFNLINNIDTENANLLLKAQWIQLAYLLGKYDLILKHFSEYHSNSNINENDLLWYLSNTYFQKKNYKQALSIALNILNSDSLYEQINDLIAHCYLQLQQYDEALKYYMRAIQYQKNADIYFNIGVLMEIKQRQHEALQYYQQAIQLDGNYVNAYKNIGNLYLSQNKINQALDAYKKAIAINPNDLDIQFIIDGLLQKNPQHAPDSFIANLFDQYAPYYDQHLTEQLKFMVPELIYSLIRKHLLLDKEKKLNILDIGCGTGLMGPLLAANNINLVGVDLSEKMLQIAKNSNHYKQLVHSNIETFNYDHAFEVIVASDVLPYLGDLNHFFHKCFQLNTSNGYLIFSFELNEENNETFKLLNTLRYAHSLSYVTNLLENNHYKVIDQSKETLRYNHKKAIEGYIILAQKQ